MFRCDGETVTVTMTRNEFASLHTALGFAFATAKSEQAAISKSLGWR
jgi:hypothetical protein